VAPQREWFEKDYYKVLGVSENATAKEIKAAYRKLSKEFHPDQNPGAEDRFKDISAAYDVLGDPEKRKEYDEVRRMGPMAAGFGGPGGGGAGPGGFSFRVDDLGDLFGGLFNRGGGAGPRGTRGRGAAGPQRGDDLEAELQLSFQGAASGVETSVNITSEVACDTCQGTGAKPGTMPRACTVCGGRGVTDDDQGFFSFSSPCNACRGQGFVVDEPCATCRGTGTGRRARNVKVRVPAGVRDGQRIRLAGRGGPGRNGGPNGDLLVTVRVASHPLFGRKGDDLTVTVPITFPEAALGADVSVPTLDGDVQLTFSPGTQPGEIRVLRGRGMPVLQGFGRGDHRVLVNVRVPRHLTPEQRRALEEFEGTQTEATYREDEGFFEKLKSAFR